MLPDRNFLSYAPVRPPRRYSEHFTRQIVAWILFIFAGIGILTYLCFSMILF